MMWDELIKFFIGTVSISGIITFLGRKIIDNSFSKSLEKYKADIEKTKYEHQVRFSKLHEERAVVIKKLFAKLVTVEKTMGSFVAIFEPAGGQLTKDEKGKIAAEHFNNFIDHFMLNEIYFQDDITELVYKIISEIKDAWYKFIAYPSYKKIDYYLPDPKLAEVEQKKIKYWIDAWKKIREDLPPLKNELKKELQKLIGVKSG